MEWLLENTWGWLAGKWFSRKASFYGDYMVIPPGYCFQGWVHRIPSPVTGDPLDFVETIGWKMYPKVWDEGVPRQFGVRLVGGIK
jgi:hypothetical protein